MNGINVAAQSNNTSTKPHPLLFTKRRMRLTIYWNYCITDMHKASISQNCQVQQRFCKLQLVYLLYGNDCLHILVRTCEAAACSETHSSEPERFMPPLYFAKFTFSEILDFTFREGFHAACSLFSTSMLFLSPSIHQIERSDWEWRNHAHSRSYKLNTLFWFEF